MYFSFTLILAYFIGELLMAFKENRQKNREKRNRGAIIITVIAVIGKDILYVIWGNYTIWIF